MWQQHTRLKPKKKDDQTKDFYLVYAMNDNGESGWYTYDSVDGTYMSPDDSHYTSGDIRYNS